ncbi:MAG: HD domain-containing protein [Lachnospiraceae bacterium]|nr:HD domain-containing protein [Lachnospiraceae bacterium]
METKNYKNKLYKRSKLMWMLVMCVAGILINMGGAELADILHLPLFLDTVGTVLTAGLGGYLPGVTVGLLSNIIKAVISDSASIYYGFINVLMAVITAFFVQKGYMKKLYMIFAYVITLSLIGGVISAIITWFLYGFAGEGISVPVVNYLYNNGTFNRFQAQLLADFMIDMADKAVTVIILIIVLQLVPDKVKDKLRIDGWKQTPLSKEARAAARKTESRTMSVRTKILLLLMSACFLIAAASTVISFILYRNSTIEDHIKLGEGVAYLAGSVIDADRVDEYIELGEAADGYLYTEQRLYNIKDSSYDIEYIYVYKIMEDGCHVVFDLDTADLEGSEPGDIVEFDEAFSEYLPALLAGEAIEPIISDETYGWLLTVYQPVYDSNGVCQCYAAIDISMDQLRENQHSFFAKLIALFLGFFIFVLTVGLWLAEFNIIYPVNTMALSASSFAYNSDEARTESVDRIRELDIHTGDEIENLYYALVKTSEDSVKYVADIQEQTEAISKMQNGLIMVLADLVESRDKCTGDHVRKTAAYAKIIMNKMKEEGIYADQLTDEFISDVEHSAPLHDIGKIKVSDVILNKPGKLTDEEFVEMKKHTTAGEDIIDKAIEIVPDTGYLNEAKNLATYHHEKWDGSGYPKGLVGEEIPLSARIMAVADVFDALVSNRSYKKGFPFEKAMDIIREGVGTHFEPNVAKAFLDAEDEVRAIAEKFGKEYDNSQEDNQK